jgi:dienelactone hydrolase
MRSLLLFAVMLVSVVAEPLRDQALQSYFTREVNAISSNCLAGIDSREDWERQRPKLRAELFEMLSLDPLPERTDLKPVITGKVEREGVVVEKLQFQSSPGLYVTANFYLPRRVTKPLPAVLYLCGHSQVKTNGISYGNKVAYQHYGVWFARNGYACLILDSLQLGEIEGIHHGTYREGMWWWNSRGYTPAGVEAWNGMRALDYLETRPEVDKTRFGVTGRSGGGAYSWWIAALDDRIKAAAPTAGITDLRNYVLDGCVEGHCDCMFFVNTYRWDYPTAAALVAPRPLLLCNSDKDTIFPLDGVERTQVKVAKIYKLLNASDNFGLVISYGPHKDTQDLQVPVFRWFNRHLKGEDPIIEMAAKPLFTAQELKVFDKIPEDQINSRIHERFVPAAKPAAKPGRERLEQLRAVLKEKVFHGWPAEEVPFNAKDVSIGDGWREVQFDSEEGVRLKFLYAQADLTGGHENVFVTSNEPSPEELKKNPSLAYLVVRGGPKADSTDPSAIQVRRRYMLVGQTLDGMRVWDIIRGLKLARRMEEFHGPIRLSGNGKQADNALVAASFSTERGVVSYAQQNDPAELPDYLNLLRFTNWDELRALASDSSN